MNKSVLILDCGATNVKACLVDEKGSVVSFSETNECKADPYFTGGLIWDIYDIQEKLIRCIRRLLSVSKNSEITAITATSFGVDGALVKKDGTVVYPVIAWKCSRTQETEIKLNNYFDRDRLYQETGLQSYHFNTINKLIWLKENRPQSLDSADHFVLMPSLILWFLSGEFTSDMSMAGTTMLTSLRDRTFSHEILCKLDLKNDLFTRPVEPGTIIGRLTRRSAELFGLSPGIPVIATGHDTQFALIGSGAGLNEPVLSSGTWEILMVRAKTDSIQMPLRQEGITIEFDAVPGICNPGVQWVASGVTEWIGRMFYQEINGGTEKYKEMISGAEKIDPGSGGLSVIPEIFPGGFSGYKGRIDGLSHDTTRAHIYRATLESLCYYTRFAMEKLTNAGKFKPSRMICVGGGSKNHLWNSLRASVLGIPLRVKEVAEATAIGAAMVSFTGSGTFKSIEDASLAMLRQDATEIIPDRDSKTYDELYKQYVKNVFIKQLDNS